MNSTATRVAIVGGGFSGSMLALHLLKKVDVPLEITIIEPRVVLGKGLAYSTTCSAHLLNVPAAGMSAFPDQPDHFLQYAQSRDSAVTDTTFVPRKTYGEYITSLITDAIKTQSKSKIEHVQSSVDDIRATARQMQEAEEGDGYLAKTSSNRSWHQSGRYQLHLANGETIFADFVVLAIGNLSGKRPRYCENLHVEDPRYLHDPWAPGAIASIKSSEEVLLVGTGLTAVDKMIELALNKHQGRIYAASRHGLLPRPHVERFVGRKSEAHATPGSVKDALHSLREQIRTARNGDDESWRLVFDGLRAQTQDWWLSLSVAEKRKFHRHLRTYFDVHRHRMAAAISNKVDELISSEQLHITAARIKSVTEYGGKLKVELTERGQSNSKTIEVDRIINCTGPHSGINSTESSLLKGLVDNKLATLSDPPTDIEIDRRGRIWSADGTYDQGLYALGPLLKGTLLESVAVPELRGQAEMVASEISDAIAKTYMHA